MEKRNNLIYFILIGIFISFLSSCLNIEPIKNNLYITSVGLEKEEDDYIITAYYLCSQDVGKSSDVSDNCFGTIKSKGKTLTEAFVKIDKGVTQLINYSMVKSYILHKSFMNNDSLEEFNSLYKTSSEKSHNFYLFYTSDKIDEIYNTSNPDKISLFYNIFSNPKSNLYIDSNSRPLHFIEYIRTYNLGFYSIKIPELSKNDIKLNEEDEDKKITIISGVSYYNNNTILSFKNKEYEQFRLIEDQDNVVINFDNLSCNLNNYKYKISVKNNEIYIKLSYDIKIISNKDNKNIKEIESLIKEYLNDNIYSILELSDEYKIDLLNINYEFYKQNKSLVNEYKTLPLVVIIK